MKKEVADKWVAALRSGKYKQSTGVLRHAGGFCCLGVLCEVAIEEGIPLVVEKRGYGYNAITYNDSSHLLPRAVLSWAEMRWDDGTFLGRVRKSLVQMNDHGATFEEIANIIETHYEEL